MTLITCFLRLKQQRIKHLLQYQGKRKRTWLLAIAVVWLFFCMYRSVGDGMREGLLQASASGIMNGRDAVRGLALLGCEFFSWKALLGRGRIRLRGVYECLAIFAPKEIVKIGFACLLDRYLNLAVISFLAIWFTLRDMWAVVFVLCFLFFYFVEEYVYGLIAFSLGDKKSIKGLLIGNILLTPFLGLCHFWVGNVLLLGMLTMDFLWLRSHKFQYAEYDSNNRDMEKTKRRGFLTLHTGLHKITRNEKLIFILAKELVQIYMEKLPLFYALLYGLLFAVLAPVLNGGENPAVLSFCFYTSVAYSMVVLSLNFFARDEKGMWIYTLYQVSAQVILWGKYLAYCMYGLMTLLFYLVLYGLLGKGSDWTYQVSGSNLFWTIFLVLPMTFFLGALAGSYMKPKIKYQKGMVDYHYNGLEIVVLLSAAYVIALPACVLELLAERSLARIVLLPAVIGFQFLLGKLLIRRINGKRMGGDSDE